MNIPDEAVEAAVATAAWFASQWYPSPPPAEDLAQLSARVAIMSLAGATRTEIAEQIRWAGE